MKQQEVIDAYEKLSAFRGGKKKAAFIHGVVPHHFKNKVYDKKTDPDTLIQLLQCIKQSAKQCLDDLKEVNVEIENQ